MSRNSKTPTPSAPRLELLEHHYGSETGCDVVFLVGPNQDACLRIPAHSHILKDATPVFGAMFSTNFFRQNQSTSSSSRSAENEQYSSIPKQIPIPDVNGKAFDNLMKYLYDETQLVLQSPETTVETLKAAHKYQCASLVLKCVNHIVGQISVDNVLLITANVAMLCGDFQNLENLYMECAEKESGSVDCIRIPQFLQRRLSDANSELSIELECAWLLHNCLDFIDRNAAVVVHSEEIEDLNYISIYHIMSRDTLLVQESLVFDAIARWADKECKRRHLPLTRQSKREVLQDLIFLPRYLRMSSSDFLSGPADSGLLTREEIETLTHLIQIGPDVFIPVSPETSPYKKIQSLGIPASKTLRIHLGYLLKPRKSPCDRKNLADSSNGPVGSDSNWKWVARLRKMRCCLLCCESSGSPASVQGSRCASPSVLSSPVRRSSGNGNERQEVRFSNPNGARREEHKAGFVERAVVIFACLFD